MPDPTTRIPPQRHFRVMRGAGRPPYRARHADAHGGQRPEGCRQPPRHHDLAASLAIRGRRVNGLGSPAYYEIRVQGVLDGHWTVWFEGLQVRGERTQTVISGPVSDQSALYGVLAKLRDLGLVLISVRRLDSEQAEESSGQERS